MEFTKITLLHGKGGSREGSVKQLEELLLPHYPGLETRFERPQLLHADPNVLAEDSLTAFAELDIPGNSVLIGISLGGLIAAKYQESRERNDIHVITISSPTWADGVRLTERWPNRVALYSSADDVIRGRTKEWPQLACAFDLPWLTHDTDRHKLALAQILVAYLNGDNLAQEIVDVQSRQETSEGRLLP